MNAWGYYNDYIHEKNQLYNKLVKWKTNLQKLYMHNYLRSNLVLLL
jgi:hypothetical protein